MKVGGKEYRAGRRGGHELQPGRDDAQAPLVHVGAVEEPDGTSADFYFACGRGDLSAVDTASWKGIPQTAATGAQQINHGFPVLDECEVVGLVVLLNQAPGAANLEYSVRIEVARWDGSGYGGGFVDAGVSVAVSNTDVLGFYEGAGIYLSPRDKVRAADRATGAGGALPNTLEAWVQLGVMRH